MPPAITRPKNRDEAFQYSSPSAQSPAAVFLKVPHIHLQPRQKHDIVKPNFTKQFETAITHQDIETMFTNHQTCQNHTDDMRNTQFIQ